MDLLREYRWWYPSAGFTEGALKHPDMLACCTMLKYTLWFIDLWTEVHCAKLISA
tara:strand:- start:177 stop:341 length:165 start_codon:yes stop_codon:yes gene_type:complete